MLKLKNNRDLNISLKVKLQLFLLPLLFSYLLVFYINEKNSYETLSNNQSLNLTKQKFKGSYLALISQIEKFCNDNDIKVSSISNDKTSIKLSASSSLNKFKKLIYKLESLNAFSNIKYVELNKSNNFLYKIELSFNKYYIKSFKKQNLETIKKVQSLKLFAIVGEFAFINKRWLRVDEFIDAYKIIEIKSSFVRLKKQNKEFILKVHKNEESIKYSY